MPNVVLKRFEQADEVRRFPRGRFEVIRIGSVTVGRATYEPGWKWSEHVGPGLNATRCHSAHVGLVVRGAATAAFDDGHTVLQPGDLFYIPPIPHDSWVVGDEPYVSLHLLHAESYAAVEDGSKAENPDVDAHCFVCGFANRSSLGVTFRRQANGGSGAVYVARREHEGWPGLLHGGVLFALLDDAAGWAARNAGRPCVTGRAEVRYRKPVPTHTALEIMGRIGSRKRVFTATAQACRLDTGDIVADLEATLFPRPRSG